MKDQVFATSMKGEEIPCDNNSYQLDHVVEQTNIDLSLPLPDMEKLERSRRAKTREAMEAINPTLAHRIIPKENALSVEEKAAVDIQRVFRGHLARKEFVERLYEKYMQEEDEMEERRRQQVEEGEVLIENYHLEQELNDRATLRRNRARSAEANAITIQRAWKAHKRQKEGRTVSDGPIDIGCAEDGYNEAEFPYFYHADDYRMRTYGETFGVDINDIYDDSLENVEDTTDDEDDKSGPSEFSENARSFPGDYMIDDEFSGEFKRMDLKLSQYSIPDNFETNIAIEPKLPEPITDWDTIESVLTNESGVNSPEDDDNYIDEDLSRKLSSRQNLQLCFVDDDVDGTDNESDAEVKVYIVDEEKNNDFLNDRSSSNGDLTNEREIDSRDSGCVPGDLVDLNIDYVTDYTPNQLSKGPVPAEESKRVLYSLHLHEEHEVLEKERDEEKKKHSLSPNSIYLKSMEELICLKAELEEKVQLISDELVNALMTRDSLHAKQESLLMEVEDLSKLAQSRQRLKASKNSSRIKL